MLLGLISPTSGTGTVLGESLERPERYLSRVGAMIETPAFYPMLSGRKNLAVLAELGGIPGRRVTDVLSDVELTDRADDHVRTYSLGMKQRLGLAAALLPDPDLLLLDEPANGLDPSGMREMRAMIRRFGDSGRTVLVSSHLLAEIEAVCDRVALIYEGHLRFQGSVKELLHRQRAELLLVPEEQEDLEALAALCREHDFEAAAQGGKVRVLAGPDQAGSLNRIASSGGITLIGLEEERASLEDAFFALTEAEEPR